jgi:hypothetical protein
MILGEPIAVAPIDGFRPGAVTLVVTAARMVQPGRLWLRSQRFPA